MKRNVRAGLGGAIALMLVIALSVQLSKRGPAPAAAGVEDYMARTQILLGGTLRDFTPRRQAGGHPDFAKPATAGWGRYAGVVDDFLDEGAKPVFASTGRKLNAPWLNADGVAVGPFLSYVSSWAGDIDASIGAAEGGTVTTAANFASWFRDDATLNRSERGSITLVRQPDNTYLFEGRLDDPASGVQDDVDFSHTYEIDTTFVYKPGRDWYVEVGTDADVWVFVDGRLVIDGAGGVEGPYMYPGIALEGSLTMSSTASIDIAEGTVATVSTNATGPDVISISNSAVIDGHLLVGPGGDPGVGIKSDRPTAVGGEVGALDEPIDIPPISVPTDLGPATGPLVLSGLPLTIDRDVHVTNVLLDTGARLTVQGHVRMLVDGSCQVLNSSMVRIEPDSSLTLYVGGLFEMRNSATFNANTKDSSLATINVFGDKTITIDNRIEVYANIRAPKAGMVVGNNSTVFGSFHGDALTLANSGRFVVKDPFWDSADASHVDISMSQRIELDRLAWLQEDGTHQMKILFAERSRPRSGLRIQTNILTLNLAGMPGDRTFD